MDVLISKVDEKYHLYKTACRHAGIMDKKCILINDINRYLYLTVLESQINNENELEVNVEVYK